MRESKLWWVYLGECGEGDELLVVVRRKRDSGYGGGCLWLKEREWIWLMVGKTGKDGA